MLVLSKYNETKLVKLSNMVAERVPRLLSNKYSQVKLVRWSKTPS
jgi:hypothetical protein